MAPVPLTAAISMFVKFSVGFRRISSGYVLLKICLLSSVYAFCLHPSYVLSSTLGLCSTYVLSKFWLSSVGFVLSMCTVSVLAMLAGYPIHPIRPLRAYAATSASGFFIIIRRNYMRCLFLFWIFSQSTYHAEDRLIQD